jgi:glycosyltransferase involved in cell wall biosynthesis
VTSEGLGADYLKSKIKKHGISNLVLLPFQPFEELPLVLGTADINIAILEPDAGVFAVPSKVLTYLCAQRPLLLSVPHENLAAKIVKENNAGLVVPESDSDAFIDAAKTLFSNNDLRQNFARNGLAYAKKKFDIEKITSKFEQIIHNSNKHPVNSPLYFNEIFP